MNKNLIYFGSGLALGIGVAYLYLKDYYTKLLDSETEKVREYYDRVESSQNFIKEDIEEEFQEEIDEKIEDQEESEAPNYGEIVEKLNYNQFSTKPKSDTIVESNSENEPEGPYTINDELYSQGIGRYETQLISYFIEDDVVLYAETDELMDDPGKLIGYDNLADLRNNDDLEEVYVRNEYMGIDYHIVKETCSYDEYLAE